MDEVQKFISNNQHQFGYIMQEASKKWIEKDPNGALTVGPCNLFIQKYGDYHNLQDKLERYEKALKQIAEIGRRTYKTESEIIAEQALS